VLRVFRELGVIAIVGAGKHSPDVRADVYRRLEALVEKGKAAERVLSTLRGFSGE